MCHAAVSAGRVPQQLQVTHAQRLCLQHRACICKIPFFFWLTSSYLSRACLGKRSVSHVKVGEDARFRTCRLRDVNHLRALRRSPTRCSRCKVGISTNTRGPNETRIFQAVCNNYCGASVPDSRAMHCICMQILVCSLTVSRLELVGKRTKHSPVIDAIAHLKRPLALTELDCMCRARIAGAQRRRR